MRLKVPPKVAILKIDNLLKEGSDIFDFVANDYWEQQDKEEKKEKDEEEKREQELQKARELGGNILAAMMGHDEPKILRAIGGSRVSQDTIDDYEARHVKWVKKVEKSLKEIYEDFTPVYLFMHVKVEYSTQPYSGSILSQFAKIKETIRAQTNVLADFYKELLSDIKSPLFYIPEKSQICYYDFICQLQSDSNEAQLCAFLFQFSFGESKEMADGYAHMTGESTEESDSWPKNWKIQMKAACDGINSKTKKLFGFPIIQRENLSIKLVFSSRFLK